jgi:diguanylate cyclase
MNFAYNLLLVALSVIVAIQAGYVGMSLAQQIPAATALNRRLLIAGSALSLAIGIWGMHFIGMLAVITPVRLDYAVLPTLISLLVCVLVTGVGIFLATIGARHLLVLGAVVLGLGIVVMHFIGMLAIHASAHMSNDPIFVLASVIIALAASALALWLASTAQRKLPLLLSAVVLGGAISGMHYVAMAGTTLHPTPGLDAPTGEAISSDFLAVIVSVVAFSISGIFMLTLVPSETKVSNDDAKLKEATAPGKSNLYQHVNAYDDVLQDELENHRTSELLSDDEEISRLNNFVPIEKNGNRRNILLYDIVYVQANAHYTYIFNGLEDLFCPLSITELAKRLPRQEFFRTHRSYIVNLAHVNRVKKALDAAIAELNAPFQRSVPVSRGRVAALRQELGAYYAKTSAHHG